MAHWLDRLYARLTARPRLFAGGFGDVARIRGLDPGGRAAPEPPDVALGPEERRGEVTVRTGRFPSPLCDLLEGPCREARFELVLPASDPAAPVCVYLAASGDEGLGGRRGLALPLVAHGLGAAILENPFYGGRRPAGQARTFLRTFDEQLAMGAATVAEGLALLAWLRARGQRALGAAGFSMGGAMAALVGARAPWPIATVPLAAGHSAAPVFTEGLLSRQLAWSALQGGARARVAALLDAVAIDRFPAPSAPHAAVLVGCRRDGYVDPVTVERLHRHWPGSELRWVDGGHVGGWLFHRDTFRRAIRDAFARLGPHPQGRPPLA